MVLFNDQLSKISENFNFSPKMFEPALELTCVKHKQVTCFELIKNSGIRQVW